MSYKYLLDVPWILCNRMKYPADIQKIFIGNLYIIIIFYIFIIFTLLSYSCMQIKHIFNNTTKYPINFLGYPGHIYIYKSRRLSVCLSVCLYDRELLSHLWTDLHESGTKMLQ